VSRARRWWRGPRSLVLGVAAPMAVTIALLATGATLSGAPESAGAIPFATANISCGGGTCPAVTATPTSGLGTDQWSYVTLSGFAPGDTPTVAYCSAASGTTLANEPCDLAAESTVVVLADGTAATSIPVSEVDPSGAPIAGDNGTNFYCTNNDPCSIDVTDPSLTGTSTKSAQNTAVIPISFAGAAAQCPSATALTTSSEYGLIQELLTASAGASCAAASPASAFNTELDAVAAAHGLSSGSDSIAFVDNPNDPAVAAALGSSSVAFIPVALTANVVAFKATENYSSNGNTSAYPDNSFNLTPTMVAGFVSNDADYQQQADPPPDPVPCTSGRSGSTCSLVTELNPSQPGFSRASSYGAFVRAGTSGSTYAVESWLCAVTNAPVTLPGGSTITESETPSATLHVGFSAASSANGCPAGDQFPALSAGGGNWFSEISPAQQANKLASGLSSQTSPSAFFAPMVWPEASYYGLDVANLQNAAGALVAPAAASIDAALADATMEPNGTLANDYADSADAGAYSMPDVVYAAVSTDPVPAATAAAERTVLDSLLSLSAPGASGLPAGFVPLTSAVYGQGQAEVAADIHAALPPPAGTGASGGSATGSAGGATNGSSAGGGKAGGGKGGGGSAGSAAGARQARAWRRPKASCAC